MKYRKWQVIEIEWVDSVHTSKWQFEDTASESIKDEYLKHLTIGYFFKETPESISVAQSKSNDGEEKSNVDAIMTIPKVAVKKIRKMET